MELLMSLLHYNFSHLLEMNQKPTTFSGTAYQEVRVNAADIKLGRSEK
jgi:hypothetical protein